MMVAVAAHFVAIVLIVLLSTPRATAFVNQNEVVEWLSFSFPFLFSHELSYSQSNSQSDSKHKQSNSVSAKERDSLGSRLLHAAYRRLISAEEKTFLEQQLVHHSYDSEGSSGSSSGSNVNGRHQHKDLFPLDSSDIWGCVLVALGLLVAASGGIGGGGILVPLLILVFGFSPKHAIPLSNFTILGSSVTNMVLNLGKRHPTEDRPLVDWDLILIMEPLTMAGAIVGAFVSKVLPDWILVLSLVALLAYTTHGTLCKGIEQWNKETEQHAAAAKSLLQKAADDAEAASESAGLLYDRPGYGAAGGKEGEDGEEGEEGEEYKPRAVRTKFEVSFASVLRCGEEEGDESGGGGGKGEGQTETEQAVAVSQQYLRQIELAEMLQAERNTPLDKAAILSTMVAVVVVLNLLKGGSDAFPSPLGLQCGSVGYWALTALVFAWVLSISLWMRSVLVATWHTKKKLGYAYKEGDVEWNERNTLLYPALCFFAGFFAGMFGVGGGIVKGPLMLQMGVHPLVAAATCAVMIMFTSVAATTMFMAFGTLTWDYAWFLFVLGLVATVVGQFGVAYLVEKYERTSLVSLSIGAVVAISTVLMAMQSVFTLIDAEHGRSDDAAGICAK